MDRTKIAIEQSIDHWERMIAFAKTQTKNVETRSSHMQGIIGESWFAIDCPLCKRFVSERSVCIRLKTHETCPLKKQYGKCGSDSYDSNTSNAWRKVFLAFTWQEWLDAAEKMVGQLKIILKLRMEKNNKEKKNER